MSVRDPFDSGYEEAVLCLTAEKIVSASPLLVADDAVCEEVVSKTEWVEVCAENVIER